MPEIAKDGSNSVIMSISLQIMTIAASPWKRRESTHALAIVDSVAGNHPTEAAMAQGIRESVERGENRGEFDGA